MENIELQPGDYTTREEIEAYAERAGITWQQVYLRICDAFVVAGAPFGEGVGYTASSLSGYGWSATKGLYFGSLANDDDALTRHLTPEQILSAGKQGDLQSEKQADKVAPKQIGELTVGVRLTNCPRDLQSVINHYLCLLDSLTDEQARDIIKSQLTDLTDLQYKQLNGESENA